MNNLRTVSGIWTFLLAIFLGLGVGVLTFVLSDVAWMTFLVTPLVIVLTVALCQWL